MLDANEGLGRNLDAGELGASLIVPPGHTAIRHGNADGFQLWSERFETEAGPDGLFKLSEKIVFALVSRIRPRTIVDPETERLSPGVDPRRLDLAAGSIPP